MPTRRAGKRQRLKTESETIRHLYKAGSIGAVAALAAFGMSAAPAASGVDIFLSGTPGSSLIDVTISGEAEFAFPFGFGPGSFQLQDFAFHAFNSKFGGSPPPGFAIFGTATNLTWGASVDVTTIQLDDDSDGGSGSDFLDDVLINFSSNLGFQDPIRTHEPVNARRCGVAFMLVAPEWCPTRAPIVHAAGASPRPATAKLSHKWFNTNSTTDAPASAWWRS